MHFSVSALNYAITMTSFAAASGVGVERSFEVCRVKNQRFHFEGQLLKNRSAGGRPIEAGMKRHRDLGKPDGWRSSCRSQRGPGSGPRRERQGILRDAKRRRHAIEALVRGVDEQEDRFVRHARIRYLVPHTGRHAAKRPGLEHEQAIAVRAFIADLELAPYADE